MKLTDILKESQHLDYRRMNVGEEKEEKGMTNEEKREFLKAVSEYKKFGESIYRSANLAEVHDSIKNVVETAHKVTLEETGDWFDKVTVNRHMKSMNESFKLFSKTIQEVNTLQQRLESCYDEMGEVLGKYYEIKEGNEFGAERAKAIAKGEDEFEVGGKKFPVTDVDAEDKENAKKFAKEDVSMKLMDLLSERDDAGTHLDRLADLVGNASSLMNVGKELKKAKYKYDFSTGMMPMYIINVDGHKFGILNKKYVDKGDREVGDIAIGLMENLTTEGKDDFVARSGKADIFLKKGYKHHNEDELTDLYSKLGKLVKGLNVKKIDLVFEGEDVVLEGASTEEKRIVMLAVRKIAKYRNVDIKTAAGDVYRAAMELERDIEKGKVKK